MKHISDRAYFYVENNYWDGLSATVRNEIMGRIAELAGEFDNRIYPLETEFFGSEANPGIDNDSRITILLTPLIENAGGYYDTANQYSRDRVSRSNERDMIYINSSSLADKKRAFAFLAHEFQHLISFNQKNQLRGVEEDIWLNELRSEYAITRLGYNEVLEDSHLERRMQAFVENPHDSLTEWKNKPVDYGHIMLFGEYIAEHWSPEVIAQTIRTGSAGINSVNESLAQNGFNDSFLDVFVRWIVASFLNDRSIDPKFGYTNDNLRNLRPGATRIFHDIGEGYSASVSDNIKDWEVRWYDFKEFTAGDNPVLKISFSSPSLTSFVVPHLVFKNDGSVNWSVFYPNFQSRDLYISGIGSEVNRVAFLPVKKDKLAGFGYEETSVPLEFSIERVGSAPPSTDSSSVNAEISSNHALPTPVALVYPDGSLLRIEGDPRVYVINGKWRRHIISPEIFKFYPHLGFDKVQVVSRETMAQYRESSLVRNPSSERVYEVDGAGIRHWLDISGDRFLASGRSFDSVFLVSDLELTFYRVGAIMGQ